MYELMSELENLPDEEKLAVMNEYNNYFYEKTESGMSENEAAQLLPSPKEIADSYRSGEPYELGGEHTEKKQSLSPLGVLLFILMIPVCAVYEALAFVMGTGASVVMLALCVAAAFFGVACFGVSALSHGFILLGIGGLFLTVALVLFSAAMFKGIAAAFAWFPRTMGRVLHRKKEARK